MKIRLLIVSVLFLGLELGFAQPFTGVLWEKKAGPVGGEVTDIEYDPGSGKIFVVVGSRRELFISSDNGDTWVKKTGGGDFNSFNDIEITNNSIYLTASFSVWRSVDGGVNFTEITSDHFDFNNANQIKRLSTGRLVVLDNSAVHFSINSGGNWTQGYTPGSGLNSQFLVNNSADQLFVIKDQRPYRSNDFGVNFSEFSTGIPGAEQVHSLTVNTTGTFIYCVTGTNIYGSDGSTGWTSILGGDIPAATTISDFSNRASFLEFSADGLGMFFMDNVNQKLYAKATGDPASSWDERQAAFPSANLDVRRASAKDFPTIGTSTVFFGTDNGVIKTTSGATTFVDTNLGISGINPESLIADVFENLYMPLSDNTGILKSSDGGANWSRLTLPGAATFIYQLTQNEDRSVLFLATDDGPYRSYNEGVNWDAIPLPGGFTAFNLFAPGDKLFSLNGDSFYYSSDHGDNWTPTTLVITGFPIDFSISSSRVAFASETQAMMMIHDFNTDTDKIYRLNITYTGSIVTSAAASEASPFPFPLNDLNEIVGVKGKFYFVNPFGSPDDQIAVTGDGGANWQLRNVGSTSNIHIAYNGYIFTTENTPKRINISRDDGISFQQTNVSTSTNLSDVRDIEIDNNGRAFVAITSDLIQATSKTIVTPLAPSGLTLVGSSSNAIAFSWDDNSSNEDEFDIFQSLDGVNFTNIGSSFDFCETPSAKGFFTAENLLPSTEYTFRVTAQNEAGFSPQASFTTTTPAACPQTIPDNRSWSAVNSGDSGFGIVAPQTVGIIHLGGGKYQVSDAALGLLTGFPYFVNNGQATFYENCGETFIAGATEDEMKAEGNGTWDGIDKLTLKWRACAADEFETIVLTLNETDPAPVSPVSPRAYVLSNTSIEVSWGSGYYQNSYTIERSLTGVGSWTQVGTENFPSARFIDNGPLTPGTTYFYRVTALNNNAPPDASAPSAVCSVQFALPKFVASNTEITNTIQPTVGSYWADFNNDGFQDYLTLVFDAETERGTPTIFQNNGAGDFSVITPAFDSEQYFIGSVADYDNDGNVDLLLSTQESSISDLYQGHGDFTFTKLNAGIGDLGTLAGEDIEISSTSWGDINNDGLLDLLVLGTSSGSSDGRNLLYRQNVNHSFTKIAGGELATDLLRSAAGFWADYNNDGFQDVLITNTNGAARLYENNGDETFTKQVSNGLDITQCFSAAWGDYNNDGFLDLFAGIFTQNALYLNNGDETFTKDISTPVSQGGQTIGATWGDFNNDGFLDLFVTGFLTAQTRLFIRDATNPSNVVFTKIENEKINDLSISHYGAAACDYNRNGYLDLSTSNFVFSENGDNVIATNAGLYDNNIMTGNWSEVILNPTSGNSEGIGGRITLQAGSITQTRELSTSNSLVSRGAPVAHFGIGNAATITNIQVKWVNGDVQNYPNPPRNQVLTINQDSQGPAITTTSPLDEATDVNTTTTISLTLDEASTAVAAKNLVITKVGSGTPTFTIAVTSAVKSGNTYTFTLPGKLVQLTEYTLTLDAGAFMDIYTNASAALAALEWRFTTTTGPDATALSPAHNTTGVASNASIQMTLDKPSTPVAGKLMLLYLNSDLSTPIDGIDVTDAVKVGDTYTFTFSPKFQANTKYNISVDAGGFVDAAGNESLEFPTGLWTFTTAPGPTISTLLPAHNALAVASNTTLAITFSEAVEAAVGKTVKVFEASDLITPVFTLNADEAVITGSTATFSLPGLLETATVYKVSMDAGAFYSSAGENDALPIAASSWSFTTSSGPQVTALSPLHNATGIDADTDLAITFGVDVNTVAAKSIKIFKTTDLVTPVETLDAASGSISGQTITYALTNLLDRASSYTITIDPGAVVSVVGSNSYAGMVSGTWSFTTSAGPQVTTLAPVHSATGVNADTDLEITFDESVAAVSGKVIRVFESSDLITPIQTLNANTGTMVGQTVTYNLTGVLSRATSYTVIVDEGAFISVAGSNDFAGIGSGSWSFTTSQGPTTSTLVPAIGSSGIFQNTGLAITFGEDVTAVAAKTIRIYKSTDGSNPVETLDATDGVKSSFTFTYTISPKLERATIYNVVVDEGAFVSVSGSNDFSGIASGIWSFTTSDGPQLTTRVPAHGATGVFADTQLAVTFNETVTAAANKTLKVFRSTDQATAVHTLSAADGVISGQTVTFTLPAKLDRATAYNVSIDAGAFVSTVGSNDFEGSASSQWSFTTDAGPIATFEPANAASNVAITAQLRLSFSRDIDRAIAGKRIRVMNGTTAIVNFDVSSNGTLAARTYTLNAPTGNWPFGSQLEVLVDPGAFVDTDENDFEGVAAGEWRFSIVEAPDATPPSINFTPIATTLEKNFSPVNISATVTDNKTVVSTILWHRKISEKNFTSTALTFNSTSDTWEGQILSSFADDMGFEYYLEAGDGLNIARLPLSEDSYFKTTLTFTGINAPSLSLPSGGTKTSWKIISVPYTLSAPQINAIFDQFPISDKSKWRMIRYTETPTPAWHEYPNNFSSIERGKGYFINTKDGGSVTLDDASAPTTNTRDNLFEISLVAGWNQIGNPYTTTINWNDVKAYNSTLQVGDLHRFQGGSYTNNPGDEQLPAMQGGFVEVETAMVIKIPFAGQTVPGDGRKGFQDLGGDINSNEWALGFKLKQADLTYALGSIGMAEDASVSRDIYDASTPPRFFDFLEINFAHPEHFQKRFTRDVVPTQGQYTWEFSVATNQEGIAELGWDNSTLIGSPKDLFLLDISRQKLINMKETGSYLFDPNESATFRVYFGENLNIAPEGVQLGKAYPNPTNGYTVIAFSLPETGGMNQQVSLELLDAMGRTMGIITQGRLNPGYHEAGFDTKEMTRGFYTYRLSVQGINGRTTKVNKLIIK